MEKARPCTREEVERREGELLSEFATRSTDARATERLYPQVYAKDRFRTEFERDHTRILHSRAFRRLHHKTQVFISPKNDHICTRLEHSLHVASVATTIARALRLNTDLVAAIAMGHDLGHAPFGHKGEERLDRLAKAHGLGGFAHELHSLRVVDELAGPYDDHPGLNLTFAVRDGIACHCGETLDRALAPERGKQPDALQTMGPSAAMPATLEGCVVRWADKAAYIGRDLEDAIMVGILDRRDIPPAVQQHLGASNREIIRRLVEDTVARSYGHDRVTASDAVLGALQELYAFSAQRIYHCETVEGYFPQVETAMELMFDKVCTLIERARHAEPGNLFPRGCVSPIEENARWFLDVLGNFLEDCGEGWRAQSIPQRAIDFIAGMTDGFFLSAFEEFFLPKGTV